MEEEEMQRRLTMTYREIDRHAVIQQILEKKLTQRKAFNAPT